MKITAISFFSFALLVSFSSALELSIEAPSSVSIDEEFSVSIEADSSDTYDVKIYVHNSEDSTVDRGEYISSIYGEDWQDSWNYIKSSFPGEKNYKLKVSESPGSGQICAQLRFPGKTAIEAKTCENIEVEEADIEEEETEDDDSDDMEEETEDTEEQEDTDDSSGDNPTDTLSDDEDDSNEESEDSNNNIENEPKESSSSKSLNSNKNKVNISSSSEEKIVLSKPSKISGSSVFVTKQEKLRLAMLLSFSLFALILLVLMARKSVLNRKE